VRYRLARDRYAPQRPALRAPRIPRRQGSGLARGRASRLVYASRPVAGARCDIRAHWPSRRSWLPLRATSRSPSSAPTRPFVGVTCSPTIRLCGPHRTDRASYTTHLKPRGHKPGVPMIAKAEAWHGQRAMIRRCSGSLRPRWQLVVADAVGRDGRHAAGVPSGSRRRRSSVERLSTEQEAAGSNPSGRVG
jgi:hypothetical protein